MSRPWPLQRLGSLTTHPVKWDPSTCSTSHFTYIDLGAIDQDTKTVEHAEVLLSSEAPSRARQLLSEGDVLVSTVRPNLNAIAIVTPEFSGATGSTGFSVLRSKPDRLDHRYLFQWTKSPDFVRAMSARATGASYPAVSDRIVRESEIPFPPLDEQRRIAAILDKADELRVKRRAAFAALDTLTEALFVEMFVTSGTTPKAWGRQKLGSHLSYLTSGSRGWAKHYSETGSPFLRIQNVLRDEISLSDVASVAAPNNAEADRTRVQAGDVLMSITADLGRTCVVPVEMEGGYINQHLCIMRSDSLVPRFLSAFLSSGDALRQIAKRNKQSVKAGLNFEDVRSLEVPVPPLDLQFSFAERAGAIDRERAKVRGSLKQLDALFASLQQRAFRGEL